MLEFIGGIPVRKDRGRYVVLLDDVSREVMFTTPHLDVAEVCCGGLEDAIRGDGVATYWYSEDTLAAYADSVSSLISKVRAVLADLAEQYAEGEAR